MVSLNTFGTLELLFPISKKEFVLALFQFPKTILYFLLWSKPGWILYNDLTDEITMLALTQFIFYSRFTINCAMLASNISELNWIVQQLPTRKKYVRFMFGLLDWTWNTDPSLHIGTAALLTVTVSHSQQPVLPNLVKNVL